jgi:CHAT domain-containing protein/tetratricopeptide (TPR) repeat protein
MWQIRGWMVVLLCCAAGVASAEAPQDARLQQAQTAFDEANALWEAGRYDDALARREHALALQEAVLGGSHPDVARSLNLLGAQHLLRGNPVQAEPLLKRALAIQEAALGQSHPDIAQTLTHLSNLYPAQWVYERPEPLRARALAIREAALGEHHLLVAESLIHLANLYRQQGLPARAEPLLKRALAIRQAALDEHHPDVAEALHTLAGAYADQGLSARAEPLYERALAIRETALGKNHPRVADSLWGLVDLYQAQGLSARAEPLIARATSIGEAALEQNPPNVANALLQLVVFYFRQGLLARAEPLFERALAIQEAAAGKSHPQVAETLYTYAVACALQGLYGRAEPLYERALAIREAALGKSHPSVADPVVGLGNLYLAQGLYTRAEPFLERALAIRQAAYGEKSLPVARALGSLGSLYMSQGLYERAEPLLKRSLAIWEALVGKSAPEVAKPLSRLGNLYLSQGDYRRAEPLLKRALAVSEAAFGRNDPEVADALHNLGNLSSAQGLYGQARPLYERALAIRRSTFGENNPRDAETLNRLAVAQLSQHRLDKALPLFTRALAISEQRLRQDALGFSEETLARFLQFLRTDEERLYALLRAYPDNARVRRLALGAALLFKGRSVEESSNISRTIYQSLGAQGRDTLERLRGLRAQLAQLSLQGPGSASLADYQRRLEELSEQSAALEADLAKRSAPLRELATLPSPAEVVDRVAAALPRDGALVELIAYVDRPLVPTPGTPEAHRPGELRYLALVLFPDATIRFRDLGPAGPIDSAAMHLRHALTNRDVAFEASAQALYQRAFQPLLPLLGTTRRLFLSPDGQLALVPFAALHDGQQFLVDAFDFTYLPSGKNLLSPPQESNTPGSVVVLADPDFSASLPAGPHSQEATRTRAIPSLPGEHFFSTLRTELAQRAWALAPLPGTRQEAKAIQRLLPQAQLFLGPEATKARLLQLPPPGVLHVATHGFFLDHAPEPTASRAVGHFGALSDPPPAARPPDPLLRSGLILAGARAQASSGSSPTPPSDGGLVTALELAGLNLWGTQLVVLSACDTGRGDVKPGQGVYGLHRAFLVAGAETVVMSLWKVDDETTRALMEAYYSNLLAGQGRATALREAMRALRRTQPHPYAWAPFIAMGRDTPLHLPVPGVQVAQHK